MIGNAPAIGGLGEVLVVDDDETDFEAGIVASGDDEVFEFDLAVTDLADFEGDVPPWFEDTSEFAKHISHLGLPGCGVLDLPEVDVVGIDAVEPAAQPVVQFVGDDF